MNATSDVLNDLRPLLVESLEHLGARITSEVAGVRARVDSPGSPSSSIYALVALLSFVRTDDPETEIAVVSVEWREDAVGGWAIDATGHGSRWLAEYVAAPGGDAAIDVGSAEAALEGIEAIIQGWVDVVVEELRH